MLQPPIFEWIKITTSGKPPAPRSNHSSCIFGNFLVIHGGRNIELYKTNKKIEF